MRLIVVFLERDREIERERAVSSPLHKRGEGIKTNQTNLFSLKNPKPKRSHTLRERDFFFFFYHPNDVVWDIATRQDCAVFRHSLSDSRLQALLIRVSELLASDVCASGVSSLTRGGRASRVPFWLRIARVL